MTEWTVGQTVFVAPAQFSHSEPYEATVFKVGRVWVEIKAGLYRFRKDGMHLEGGYGTVWASEAEYRAYAERNALYRRLREKLSHNPPSSITTQDIISAAKLLGMEI